MAHCCQAARCQAPQPAALACTQPTFSHINPPPPHTHTPLAGNNAVEMETTATFDQATDEWIIHTPSSHGQK